MRPWGFSEGAVDQRVFALALLSTSIPTGSERDAHRNSDCHAHADVAECRAYADACPSADCDA